MRARHISATLLWKPESQRRVFERDRGAWAGPGRPRRSASVDALERESDDLRPRARRGACPILHALRRRLPPIWPALPQCGLRSRACILGSALWGRRSGVCTGGRLFGALGLVDGILARPVRDELQERADGGELLEEEVALVVAVEPGVDLRGAWKRV